MGGMFDPNNPFGGPLPPPGSWEHELEYMHFMEEFGAMEDFYTKDLDLGESFHETDFVTDPKKKGELIEAVKNLGEEESLAIVGDDIVVFPKRLNKK